MYATHEDAKLAFKELLREKVHVHMTCHLFMFLCLQNIPSTFSWDQAMKQIIDDVRYR